MQVVDATPAVPVEATHVRSDVDGTNAALARAVNELAAAVQALRAGFGGDVAAGDEASMQTQAIDSMATGRKIGTWTVVENHDLLRAPESAALARFGRPSSVRALEGSSYTLEYKRPRVIVNVAITDGRVMSVAVWPSRIW